MFSRQMFSYLATKLFVSFYFNLIYVSNQYSKGGFVSVS